MESLVSYGSEDEQDLEPIPQNTNTMGRTRDHRERDVRPTLGHHRDRRDRDRDRDRDTRDRDRDTTRELQEDNYDNVGMDMSDEESNNNSSPHRNDDRRNKNRAGYSRESYEDSSTSRIRERSRSSELSRERDNSRYNNSNKSREETNNRYSRKPYDDYKQRRSSRTPPPPPSSSSSTTKNYDFKSSRYDSQKTNKNNYDRKDLSSSYHGSRNSRGDERKPDRDRRRPSSPVRDGERSRRSNSKERRRSSSKDYSRKRSRTPPLPRYKRRSNSRDRDRDRDRGDDLGHERSKSYDRREKSKSLSNRSKSRERSKSKDINRDRRDRDRDRSRSRDRRDRRDDRSRSRDRDRRGDRDNRSSRSPYKGYKGRYDRTSNKLAVLEKLGIEIKTPDSQFITPQMLMQKSMTDKIEEVKNATGIELPKYYNPAVMNPSRYAEQIQKRRLLWGNKNKSSSTTSSSTGAGSNTTAPSGSDHQTEQIVTAPTSHLITTSITNNEAPSGSGNGTGSTATIPKVWQQTKFVHDNDGKVASKFKRLMGIKDDVVAPSKELTNAETLKKQEEMFHSMEAQYEVARAATHTMRGVGLGFGAFGAGNFTR